MRLARIPLLCLVFIWMSILGCPKGSQTVAADSNVASIISEVAPMDFLRDDHYTKLEIEILCMESCQPDADALAFLKKRIRQHCHKPDGIRITIRPEIAIIYSFINLDTLSVFTGWMPGSLADFKTRHHRSVAHDSTLVLYILYVPGFYLTDLNCIGVTFSPDCFAIFKHRLPSGSEGRVLLHEFGHILGLTKGDKEDPKHSYHCENPKCVMYWTVGSENDDTFDEPCQKDIVARGGQRIHIY